MPRPTKYLIEEKLELEAYRRIGILFNLGNCNKEYGVKILSISPPEIPLALFLRGPYISQGLQNG